MSILAVPHFDRWAVGVCVDEVGTENTLRRSDKVGDDDAGHKIQRVVGIDMGLLGGQSVFKPRTDEDRQLHSYMEVDLKKRRSKSCTRPLYEF